MTTRNRNPAVEALEETSPDASHLWQPVSLREWRRAFKSFENYDYPSVYARLRDMLTIQMKGVEYFLDKKQWQKMLELAEWALADRDLIEHRERRHIDYLFAVRVKADALNELGRGDKALDFYLREASHFKGGVKSRRVWLLSGNEVVWSCMPEGTDPQTRATAQAARFAHDLIRLLYPKRRMPKGLQAQVHGRTATWADIQTALSPPAPRVKLSENPSVREVETAEPGWMEAEKELYYLQWKRAFESLNDFEYSSTASRLKDLEAVFTAGQRIYERLEEYKKLLKLTDWAINDEELASACVQRHAFWSKIVEARVEALFELGRQVQAVDDALRFVEPLMAKRGTRVSAVMPAMILLSLFQSYETEWEAPARLPAVKLVRNLLRLMYPKRPLPAILGEEPKQKKPTWGDLQRVLESS